MMKKTGVPSVIRTALVAFVTCSAVALGEEGAAHSDGPSIFAGDLGNILWSLVTFLLVLVVLGKFAWKPILSGLQGREEFIRDSLAQAKKDREEAEARLKEYGQKLETARAEATELVEEGRRDAEAVKQTIEETAPASHGNSAVKPPLPPLAKMPNWRSRSCVSSKSSAPQ